MINLTKKIDILGLFKEHSFLGVDIGTSSIKIVQLTKHKNTYKLDTYGEIQFFDKGSKEELEEQSLKMLDDQVADLLKSIVKETGAKAKKASMAVPVFSSFSTIMEMPDLEKNELKKAIEFQARQYVPAPIDQLTLSSVIVKREDGQQGKKGKIQVLLVAIPNEVKLKYTNIASLSGLELMALEMETFPMARSILKGRKDTVLIVDIGLKSTNYCIADEGFVKLSHNYDISGASLTQAFLDFAGGDYKKAENLKKTMGLKMTPGQMEAASDIFGYINSIIIEADRIMNEFFNKNAKRVQSVVLSGGSAWMPGLLEYFQDKLNVNVSVANPFAGLVYPKELEETLKEIGPSFAIAIGLAMRK